MEDLKELQDRFDQLSVLFFAAPFALVPPMFLSQLAGWYGAWAFFILAVLASIGMALYFDHKERAVAQIIDELDNEARKERRSEQGYQGRTDHQY